MQVQRVVIPASGVESWTVLGDDDIPFGPAERWLAYLTSIGRSPNTVKACAHDLKDFLVFLAGRGVDWREGRLENPGGDAACAAVPPPRRAGTGGALAPAGATPRARCGRRG